MTIILEQKKLEPKLMNNGNNQEGIGIYFGSLKTAETYGTNIVKTEINPKNFIDSRKDIIDFLKIKQIENILIDMWKSDEETMYYMITDWIEVSEPEDISISDIKYLADKMKYDEVRNFQITLAEQFGVVEFVESWNKHCKNIYGTYQVQNKDETWYCIINTKVKVSKI
jgi:hypothetical protein